MKPRVFLCCIFMCLFFLKSFGQNVKVFDNLAQLQSYNRADDLSTITTVQLLGHRIKGDGGGGMFIWVDNSGQTLIPSNVPSPIKGSVFVRHNITQNTPASELENYDGYWQRVIENSTINAMWLDVQSSTFADANANSNAIRIANSDRLDDAIATAVYFRYVGTSVSSANQYQGFKIYIPGSPKPYYFNRGILINKCIELFGDGSIGGGNNSTKLIMKNGMTDLGGIMIERSGNINTDFVVKINNLHLSYQSDVDIDPGGGAFHPTGTTHGIYAKLAANIEKVSLFGFPGDGFHFEGVIGQYSSDFCKLIDCGSQGNSGNGFYIIGGEAQEGLFSGCDSRNNLKWGYYDASFLGNSYMGCTSNGNGRVAAGGSPSDPVVLNSDGGGFKVTGASNRSRFIGCYSEGEDFKNESESGNNLIVGGTYGALTENPQSTTYQFNTTTNSWEIAYNQNPLPSNDVATGATPTSQGISGNRSFASIDADGGKKVRLRTGVVVPGDMSYDIIGYPLQQATIKSQEQNSQNNYNIPAHGLGLQIHDGAENAMYTLSPTYNRAIEKNLSSNKFLSFQRGNSWNNTSYLIAQGTTSKNHFGYYTRSTNDTYLDNTSQGWDNIGGRMLLPFGVYFRSFDGYSYPDFPNPVTPDQSPFDNKIEQYRFLGMANRSPTFPNPGGEWDGALHQRNYGVGDIIFNTNPKTSAIYPESVGDPTLLGWRCTQSGSPGNWQELRLGNSGATNGLSLNTNNQVELGGTLTKHTNIEMNGNTFNFNYGPGVPYVSQSGNPVIGFKYTPPGSGPTQGALITLNGSPFIHGKGGSVGTTYVGPAAGASLGGGYCTAVGASALYSNIGAYNNTAVGASALSTVSGPGSGGGQVNGNGNTAVGSMCLKLATGAFNTAFGYNSSSTSTSGNNNMYLGANAYPIASTLLTGSNKLYINNSTTVNSDGTPFAGSNIPLIGGQFKIVDVNNNIIVKPGVTINRDLSTANFLHALDVGGSARFSKGVIIAADDYANFATAQTQGYNLIVRGKILADELWIQTSYGAWPDYVFDKDYKLRRLDDLEKYINANKHLPGITSAEEIRVKGSMDVKNLGINLLEKVEELTLYAIEAEKKCRIVEEKNKSAEEKIQNLEERLKRLEALISEKK